MNTGMSVALIKASEIAQWMKMFIEHTGDCYTEENIKLKALGYEQKLRSVFPDKQIIESVIDDEFINNHRANPKLYKEYLDKLILYTDILSNGFPLFGSMVDAFCKSVQEVILLCQN